MLTCMLYNQHGFIRTSCRMHIWNSFTRPRAKTIKKNTNSTQNKSQTHHAKQYEVTSFLSTDCELSTETCSKNVYSLGTSSHFSNVVSAKACIAALDCPANLTAQFQQEYTRYASYCGPVSEYLLIYSLCTLKD